MKRRAKVSDFDRRSITADLAAAWLDPEPQRPTPYPHVTTDAELLAAVGRDGLDWHRQMRRRQVHGMLSTLEAV